MQQHKAFEKNLPAKALDFGSRLKMLRILAGLNQEQLAEKSEVSRVSINRWETSGRPPTAQSIEMIAKELGVNSRYLQNGGRAMFPERAIWRPVAPANPKYLNRLKDDLVMLLPVFFDEAGIDNAATYTITSQEMFILLWRSQQKDDECIEIYYLVATGQSQLSTIVKDAVNVSVKSKCDLGELQANDSKEGMIAAERRLCKIFSKRISINSGLKKDDGVFCQNRCLTSLLEAFGAIIIEKKYDQSHMENLVSCLSYKHPCLLGSSLQEDVATIKLTIDSFS